MTTTPLLPGNQTIQSLYDQAVGAAAKAYSPYSNKKDGAVVLTESGKTYEGINYEGVANRAGMTATQGALMNATMQGDTVVRAIAFGRADGSSTGSPPGSDLQAAVEMLKPGTPLDVIFKFNGEVQSHPIADVLTDFFRPADVNKVLDAIKAGTMPPAPPQLSTRAERNAPSGHLDIAADNSYDREALLHFAQDARYDTATRSGYGVGAAVLAPNGDVFTGTNIGQDTSRLGTCAETEAAVRARSAGNATFRAVAVATPEGDDHGVPCGSCRDHLAKFDDPKSPMEITWKGVGGAIEAHPLAELLPFHHSHQTAA